MHNDEWTEYRNEWRWNPEASSRLCLGNLFFVDIKMYKIINVGQAEDGKHTKGCKLLAYHLLSIVRQWAIMVFALHIW
jgi:hypothetical protein